MVASVMMRISRSQIVAGPRQIARPVSSIPRYLPSTSTINKNKEQLYVTEIHAACAQSQKAARARFVRLLGCTCQRTNTLQRRQTLGLHVRKVYLCANRLGFQNSSALQAVLPKAFVAPRQSIQAQRRQLRSATLVRASYTFSEAVSIANMIPRKQHFNE